MPPGPARRQRWRMMPAALLAVLLAAAAHPAGEQAAAQPGGPLNPTRGTLIFSYPEATITDAQRARIVTLLPGIYPDERWPTIPSGERETLPTFIGRVFRVVVTAPPPPGQRLLPLTAAALTAQIRRVNSGLAASGALNGRPLKVPPLPPAGGSMSPDLMQWATPTADLWTTTDAGEEWRYVAMIGPAPPDNKSFEMSGITAGYSMLTGIPANAPPAALNALVAIASLGVAGGTVDLDMAGSTSSCPPAETWVKMSPYYADAVARVTKEKAKVLERAASAPLVILDFNFDRGHGAQVVSAAATLLEAMGIPELAAPPYIRTIELNPAANGGKSRDDLRRLFVNYYKQYGGANGVVGILPGQALQWIELNDTGANDAAATIDASVLQAALWTAVQTSPWLNLSWWTRRQAVIYPAGWPTIVRDKGIFGVVAAGNAGQELPTNLEPQQQASSSPTWLNVTFGSRSGTVGTGTHDGNRTRADRGAFVDTIGPGCGFARQPLQPDVTGSSYASPFVAAAAWLKHLLDETPSTEMRQRIWLASPLVPAQPFPAESNGVFEAARLLSDVGPHMLTTPPGPGIVAFTRLTIQDRLCGTYDSASGRRATFAMAQTPAGPTLFIREARAGVPGGEVRTCIVEPQSFSVTIDGAAHDAAWFVKEIREIVF